MTEREKMKLEFGMTDEEYDKLAAELLKRIFWESDTE